MTEPAPRRSAGADPARLTPSQVATIVRLRAAHWQRARRTSVRLLLLWAGTTFGSVFYARELAHLTLFGWPLSFYLAAQGACLVYLAIIGAYAWRMHQLDRLYLAQEEASL